MTKTSFRNLLRSTDVLKIEIPIIQRDFAQGRQHPDVRRIRKSFLDVLKTALLDGESISLDFVYGDTKNGRFVPVDGQQRLTTLFLLHWYLAVRCDVSKTEREFLTKFTYYTRFSSRDFCNKLASTTPELDGRPISEWLKDQHWFAGSWKKDPTIRSMLVVLDDISDLFRDVDDETCKAAWNRLVSEKDPSITFEILSLVDMGLTDELYIKMNSRGKPLTEFEHFKAQFEQTLKEFEGSVSNTERGPSRYHEFINKIDQDWADLVWPLRGTNDNADDKFLRLFRFITDIIIWRHGIKDVFEEDLDGTARKVYGDVNSETSSYTQDHLFNILDSLRREFASATSRSDIDRWFQSFFTNNSHEPGRVAIFGETNLLVDCCENYGSMHGRNRAFSLPRALLFHALLEYVVMEQRVEPIEIANRLRCLRNVIFASASEIRIEYFASLLDEVRAYITNGDLGTLRTFNNAQMEEEAEKARFLERSLSTIQVDRSLQRLEDHDLLRGSLAVFDLQVDPDLFIGRAEAFHVAFDKAADLNHVAGALLACGDYSWKIAEDRFQFGSPISMSVWRDLFTTRSRDGFANTRTVLMQFLDKLRGVTPETLEGRLSGIVDQFLVNAEAAKLYGWRYYLIKYPVMRSGKSGIFISPIGAMGFDLCMMEHPKLSSYYSDPYIRGAVAKSGLEAEEHFKFWQYGWDGYEAQNRWTNSAITSRRLIRTTEQGFQVRPSKRAAVQAVHQKHKIGADGTLNLRQSFVGGEALDKVDRILAGSRLLKDLIDIGE